MDKYKDKEIIARKRAQNGSGTRRFRRLATRLALLAAAVSCAGIAGVYAWNMHEVDQQNYLQSHSTSVRIDETFEEWPTTSGTNTKKVAFTNTGSSPVFLRVAYSEQWYIVPWHAEWEPTPTPSAWFEDDGTHVTKNWTSAWTDDWVLKDDGWYYYKKVLPAGATTADILSSVSFLDEYVHPYSNAADYSLDFLVEAVQLSDEASVNTQATQKVFGRTATVTDMIIENGAVTGGTVDWS